MIERLGNVIYWAGSGLGIIFFALAAMAWYSAVETAFVVILVIIGLLVWLTGRAVLYILAGR